jgi:hypothetical protein
MRPFYLSDPAKGRYRLITDVPHLNKSIKGKVRAALPKITKMYRQLLSTSWIVSADFACFYFQLPLHKRKGSAYTFRHKGRLYRWKVVPMGAGWSCKAAQEVAAAFCSKVAAIAGCAVWYTTYIDNLYWGCNSEADALRIRQAVEELATQIRAKFTMEHWQRGTVLGVTIDLIEKVVTVLDAFYAKHSQVWSRPPDNLQEMYRWTGVLIRAHYVLRGQLASISRLLGTLSSSARLRAAGREEDWVCTQEIREAIQEAQQITKKGTRANVSQDDPLGEVDLLVYSDAAEWGAGAVCITESRIWTHSIPWSEDESYQADWAQVDREARAATNILRRVTREGLAEPGHILLAVDAGVLVFAEKRGHSLNSRVREFVETARSLKVRTFHVRSKKNIADAPSRGKEPLPDEEVLQEISNLSETFKESKVINTHPRSTW